MTKVRLYDPHPGFAGAVPLPRRMKELADSLDGNVLTLEDAIEKITPVAESLGGRIEIVEEDHQYILFEMSGLPDYVMHVYRLIRYEDA